MIKAITTVRFIKNKRDFDALNSLFSGLGFEPGEEWKSAKGQGRYFLAPVAKLELVLNEPLPADLWVEVTDLDSIFNLLKQRKVKVLSDVQETGWGSRAFVAEPAKGMKIAFWQPLQAHEDAIEGDLNSRGMRFGIVVSRWNSFITERLLQGAIDALRRTGCRSEDITIVRVPGSFEIPSQARTLAGTGKYDAIITLGCLIRGETTHYEHIATEVTRGIGQSAQETGVPHTYGVLTCENLEQALDRAGLKAGNKGFEAASSAVEMVSLKRMAAASRGKNAKV
jgi:6,7-dimethyl-8-ribityllumazine synthase